MLINNEEWEIRFVSPTSSILRNTDGSFTLGVTVPKWRKIYINCNISGKLLRRVIAHEVSHAEFASRGIIVPLYIEEGLADILSDNIVDVNNITNIICNYCGKCDY